MIAEEPEITQEQEEAEDDPPATETENPNAEPDDANYSRSNRILNKLSTLIDDVRDYDLNQTNHYKVLLLNVLLDIHFQN